VRVPDLELSLLDSYRMRLRRKRLRLRAVRRGFDLSPVADRTKAIGRGDILLFSTVRNECVRLPYFLDYYRKIGIARFLIVENASDDGTREFLADQPDVSLWTTRASYGASRFGADWLNWLQRRHGHGHWTVTVDADEFLVYPFCDTRPLRALTDWLDVSSQRTLPAMLLDMYPRGRVGAAPYRAGQDPFASAGWFDAGNYTISINPEYRNLWIQGGPRARVFFADDPYRAPALNKIPLVKWDARYTWASSTHALLPRGLNRVYDEDGGEKISGCLLHAKFLDTFVDKSREEASRGEHFADSYEYLAYLDRSAGRPDLWCSWSERYEGWRQLDRLGLMSTGNWA
jgi:hypothetical protein